MLTHNKEKTAYLKDPENEYKHPNTTDDWWAFDVHYWDSGVVCGFETPPGTGGTIFVWAIGHDWADAAANAIRFVESMGHRVDQISSVM